jgi:hypothetical protein
MACGCDKKKTHKPNYRMEELEVLVEDVAVNKQLLANNFPLKDTDAIFSSENIIKIL